LGMEMSKAHKGVLSILRKLWGVVVSPVRDKLTELQVPERTRVWWCPTSTLCSLPLHAAGPYKKGQKNFLDIYTSSYTPTLATLIRARSGTIQGSTLPKLLVMGQPGLGDNVDEMLPGVREEIRRIHSFGDFVDVLMGDQANRQAVLSQLQEHNWIHFSCHAIQAWDRPFESYFQLCGDEHLTLIDIVAARHPNPEFAFLSACHTATSGDTKGTPDEVIHLAAAVQFCGFRSVVGTLWALNDNIAVDVTEAFYRQMFCRQGILVADFRDSAKALNAVTRDMISKRIRLRDCINLIYIGA